MGVNLQNFASRQLDLRSYTLFMANFLSGITISGFIYLIVRELLSGIRDVFKDRVTKVKLLKSLEFEISEASQNIEDFFSTLQTLVEDNKTAQNGQYRYRPFFPNSSNEVYRQNIARIQHIMFSSGSENYRRIRKFYDLVDAHQSLLALYRERYGGNLALTSSKDPHVGFLEKAKASGLNECSSVKVEALTEIQKVRESGHWRTLKKKPVYLLVKVFLFLLIIFVPDKDAL